MDTVFKRTIHRSDFGTTGGKTIQDKQALGSNNGSKGDGVLTRVAGIQRNQIPAFMLDSNLDFNE
ncbi:hypothetical protein AVEN_123920-1, partial [Araneus ventricosus]